MNFLCKEIQLVLFYASTCADKLCEWLAITIKDNELQGVPKKPQSIENNLLLEFQWPSTNLKVKSAQYWQGAYIKYWRIKKLKYLCNFLPLGI